MFAKHLPLLLLLLPLACGPREDAPPSIPPGAADSRSMTVQASDDDDDDDAADDEVPDVGGDATVAAIVALGHNDSKVADHVAHLTEEIGPRLTGSHRLMEAELWCQAQFESWGLKAWREQWGEFPVGFDRGPWSGGMVTPEEIEFDFVTPAWTPGVFGPARGALIGYPKTLAEVKTRKAELKGAWLLRGDDVPRPLRDKIDAALQDAGVLGVIHSARDEEGKLVHTSGKSDISWNKLPTLVEINLRADQFKDLAERLAEKEAVELAFSIDNRFFAGPVPQYNVIAELKGTEKPDEIVVVGGHLDSWDGATGANDNGTGVATTMEAARLLMAVGAKPKRTIRFMLWTGEEQGLLGSEGYVEAHGEELDKYSAVFVHDGGTNYLSGIAVTPEMRPQFEEAFAPLTKLAPDEMPFAIVDADSLQPGGSDHSPFIRAGVPGFFWEQDGKSDYDYVHHTQHDTLANVVPQYQKHSAMVVAIAAYQVANLPELIDRRNSAPLPRRQMGGMLDRDMTVSELEKDGLAAKSGWKLGDKVISMDGETFDSRWAVFRAAQKGDPKKTFVVERKGKQINLTLDWTGTAGEIERATRQAERDKSRGK